MQPAATPSEAIANFVRVHPTYSHLPSPPGDSVMSSLRFVKSRSTPGLEVRAIQWADTAGATWSWILSVWEVNHGAWRTGGGGGGNGPQPLDHPFSPSAYFVGAWGGSSRGR